ncbi:MAG TPA: DUF6089 family protein [Mucilaginibacter sp.]|nr:DUF6089 family protein [Mucilaginibacter sp.]
MGKLIPFIFFAFITCSLKAQTWEVGAAAGGSGYMGDLNTNNPVKISGYSVGGFVKRNFDGYWSAKVSYTYGKIAAADSNSSDPQFRQRNLSFTTTLSEVSLVGEFNFMKYIPDAGKNKYTPYIFLGGATVNYFPYTIYKGNSYGLRSARTEDQQKPYPTAAFSLVYGAGFKYNFSGKLTVGAQLGYRLTNTDYLDDVGGYYANRGPKDSYPGALADRSGEKTGVYIGSPGVQRGDMRPRDMYFFSQITLSYTFVTEKCYFE